MKELKMYKDGSYDIEIVDVYEEGNLLKVKTRCPWGEDVIGLSLKAEYIDRDGIPKWRKQVKNLIEQKYGKHISNGKTTALKKSIDTKYKGIKNIKDLDKD
ncbi:MAG: hypothetical protein PWQ59_458 [Thermoanaerobacterium sp.]|nr:hypothetical protein [Thermoanaerobacterium sp.]